MALATVVTLEKPLPDPAVMSAYEKGKSGKALAREAERIDSAARRANVQAIYAMLSENQDALRQQMIEDGFDPSKMRLPPELWFDPAEGLKTVRGLHAWVSANLNDFKQPNPILRDLKAAEPVLDAAAKAGVRFHFSKVVL